MFWAFIVYHKRKSGPLYPKQTKENLPLELVYTFVPFLMVGVLFYFTVTTENFALEEQPNPDVTVEVTAFKWNWDFGYPGTTVPGGGEVHTVGTSEEVPILVLPANKLVQYNLRSKDVVHSFWTIDFLFKRDVFPYPEQNQSVNHLPEHHRADRGVRRAVRRTVRDLPQRDELRGARGSGEHLQRYLDLRQTVNPATGQPFSAADALSAIGKRDPSCGELCAPLATTTYPLDTNRTAKSESLPQQAGGN